jgi:hypothetical protein
MKSASIYLSAFVFIFTVTGKIYSQQLPVDYSGAWKYEIKNTPYGDFSGKIQLDKDKDTYKAAIINDGGTRYWAKILRFKGSRIVMATNLEETDGLLSGYFQGDSLVGRLEVKGDAFVYKIIAKKTYEIKDSRTP